jgi:hypothetical protein
MKERRGALREAQTTAITPTSIIALLLILAEVVTHPWFHHEL